MTPEISAIGAIASLLTTALAPEIGDWLNRRSARKTQALLDKVETWRKGHWRTAAIVYVPDAHAVIKDTAMPVLKPCRCAELEGFGLCGACKEAIKIDAIAEQIDAERARYGLDPILACRHVNGEGRSYRDPAGQCTACGDRVRRYGPAAYANAWPVPRD